MWFKLGRDSLFVGKDYNIDSINDIRAKTYLIERRIYEDSLEESRNINLRNSPYIYYREDSRQDFSDKLVNPGDMSIIDSLSINLDTLSNFVSMNMEVVESINRLREEVGLRSVFCDSLELYKFSDECISYNYSAAIVKDIFERCPDDCKNLVIAVMLENNSLNRAIFSNGLEHMSISIIKRHSSNIRKDYVLVFIQYEYFGNIKNRTLYIR
jgi:hypothetical protein